MPDLTSNALAWLAVALFVLAYAFVIAEEFTHLRKSKPLMVAAGAIWLIVAIAWRQSGIPGVGTALRHNLLEYAEILLFLLAAMTFVNTLEERRVFDALREYVTSKRLSFRQAFWVTGAIAFFLSPLIDNLTTALVMGAIVVTMGKGNAAFIAPACINIVIAANAGGAFSPFGDITTLMVWQKGSIGFFAFFDLFIPSCVNWLIPALCMSFAVPSGLPSGAGDRVGVKRGGYTVILLFALTIAMTVCGQQLAQLPPFFGMMTGLGLLQLYGYRIRRRELREARASDPPFDIFVNMKKVEWDTLLFFYGVTLCIGGLGALGYLKVFSALSYETLGPSTTNILMGVISAVIDNIPIMFAVLSLHPAMSQEQWLLVTLTTGVGGSLLSIGSAAGVALMGQARGIYTFGSHLRWSWAVALGYAGSIAVHRLISL
jgi:Na+/H+ antiporter NhaD/arsenite permease-like protein